MGQNVERVTINPTGDKVTILHGTVNVHQFQGTSYKLNSVGSIIDMVKEKGSPANTVIFCSDKSIQVILDDTVMDRPHDTAVYGYAYSNDFKDWNAILDTSLPQKAFANFLKTRTQSEFPGVEDLLAKVSRLNLVTEIVGDYQYDDNNNVTFMFKTKDAEGMVKLPSVIVVNLILFDNSDYEQAIELELELYKPKSEHEKPAFTLKCPKLPRYIREATEYETERLKEALKGYLILAGSMR